jgi:hypothetical protein
MSTGPEGELSQEDTARQPFAGIERKLRFVLTIGLGLYGTILARTPTQYTWLDSLDLAIHEAGHLVFFWGGDVVAALGGTLLQLIVPTAFVIYFARRHDGHAASVALWWVAQNCWNISVYLGDARTQALPLVGGGEHDWAYLLGRAGWLARDGELSKVVHFVGVVLLMASVLWGIAALKRQRRSGMA